MYRPRKSDICKTEKKNAEIVSVTDVKLLKGGRLVLWVEMKKVTNDRSNTNPKY